MANTSSAYWAMVLREYMEQGALASVYTEPEAPENFYAGYVEAVNAKQFALRSVTIDGTPDGWFVARTADVLQVLGGEEYEQRLAWLIELRDEPPALPLADVPEDDIFRQYLRRASETGKLVTIWISDVEDGISGRVHEVDDLRITLEAFDFFGQTQYTDSFTLSQIDAISIDAAEERMYAVMNRNTPPGVLRLL